MNKQLLIAVIVALVVGYAVGKVFPLGNCNNQAAACETAAPVEGQATTTEPTAAEGTAAATEATTAPEAAPAATTPAPATSAH